ncbi:MAG: hypothetical protein ACYC7A_08805 [Thermoanaerobaculia bacterium]
MRRALFAFCVFAVLLVPLSAFALRTTDQVVIIPIIGRFPGAGTSQWRTDVFLANPYSPTSTVALTLYVAGGAPVTRSFTMPPYSSLTLRDIVLTNFGLTNASGQLKAEVISPSPGSIDARARIYNVGNPIGQFGQAVPGIGTTYLRRQAYMGGLSGLGGNRVNIGVANPDNAVVTANLTIKNKLNVSLYSETITLQPHQTQQFNDIFARWSIAPQDDVVVQFNTGDQIIYGYASEVRNDSGDAIFIFGTGPNV